MDFTDIRKRVNNYVTSSRLTIPILLASIVGIATGLIVVGFIRFIDFAQYFFFVKVKDTLFFLGAYSLVLIPAIGGLLVGPLVTYLAPEAKGHGVPEVMKAIALRGGRMRPIVVVVKALASALAIGSGASVGREGPIVQVGSAFGSSLAQFFKLSELRIKNLVACGAAAGIAGVFNAPIAGVMFALEVILKDFGARALSTVVVASVSASIISRIFLGDTPAFVVPVYSLWSPFEIFLYLGLGVLSAFVAFLFISTLHKSEEFFEKIKFPEWLKPVLGGLVIGAVGLFYPQIFGTGLRTIEQALHGNLALKVLFFLVFIKIFATSISLGSGSSGGVFAPALFIGAVLGGTFGKLFFGHLPFDVAPPGAYALVGMASVFAGAAHAPVTAILIVFEMTGDYQIILPLMIAVVVSTSLSQLLRRESIYTIKLKERGIDVQSLEGGAFLGAMQVGDAMTQNFETVRRKLSAKELIEGMKKEKDKSFFVVNKEGELTGEILPKTMQEILLEKDLSLMIADDIATPIEEICHPTDPLGETAHFIESHHLTQLPVADSAEPKKIIGVLRSENIFHAYTDLALKREELVSRMEQEDFHAGGTEHIRFNVSARSLVAGKEIKDLNIPDGIVLTSIQRKQTTLIPEGHTVLKAKDKVWAVVLPQNEKAFRDWLKANKLK